MEIRKYKCPNCDKEHIDKLYENKSEALADVVEVSFKKIFDDFKDKHKDLLLEDFCKEFSFEYLYHFHRNLKRIRVDKKSIKSINNPQDNAQNLKKEEDKIDKKIEVFLKEIK